MGGPPFSEEKRDMDGGGMRGTLGGGTMMKGGRGNVIGWEMIN